MKLMWANKDNEEKEEEKHKWEATVDYHDLPGTKYYAAVSDIAEVKKYVSKYGLIGYSENNL